MSARMIQRRAALAGVLSLAVQAAACKSTPAKQDAPKGGRRGGGGAGLKYPVDVYPVETHKVSYLVTSPGNLQAFERVQITARVAGAVDKVNFSEGQTVKAGEVLVVIDTARYQSAVASAQASLDRTLASQKDAEAQVARRKAATEAHPGLIPGEELATYETKVLTAKGDTGVATEALRAASLNLQDSSVKAPMDGVVQTRTVETGQYVTAGFLVATILRDDPMLLKFNVSPLDAPRVQVGMIASFKLRETDRTFHAKVTLVSAAADDDSHMVAVTGEVQKDGHDYWLRPGSFADVTLDVGGSRDAVVIPRDAVRASERGFVAYVVAESGDKVNERVLDLGQNTKDGWVEVRKGLTAGDKLVIRGSEPLVDGSGVEVNPVAAPVSSSFKPAASVGPPTGTPSSIVPSSMPPIKGGPPAPPSSAPPSPDRAAPPAPTGGKQ